MSHSDTTGNIVHKVIMAGAEKNVKFSNTLTSKVFSRFYLKSSGIVSTADETHVT